MSSTVSQIKEKLDIAEVVGSYIKLEKAGSNLKAKCPFHNEKTPSFFISPERASYYCFGCGAKGDIFTFVQEIEGLDFYESLKLLAERAGVTIENNSSREKGEKERLFEILDIATQYFQNNLSSNKEAQDYLKERSISTKTIKDWRLGYAKEGWRDLREYLLSVGVTDNEMQKSGLTKRAEVGKNPYDVFRGRIIFPIFDSSGKVSGFSGRIFPEALNSPKYLNSPETDVFKKSEILYGLHIAKTDIRKKGYSILVEGQVDLLMCHQKGYVNAVASSGTAFGEDQIMKLRRLSDKILIVFDSDSAGFNAASKTALSAISLGMDVKLAQLPSGFDPAELIVKNEDEWKMCLKQSKHLIDFQLDKLLSEKLEERKLGKEIQKRILPLIAQLQSSIEQSHFVSEISKRTGIREEAIWNDLRASFKDKVATQEKAFGESTGFEVNKRKNYIERRLFGIYFWQNELKEKVIDFEKFVKSLKELVKSKFETMLKEHEREKIELVFEAESYGSDTHTLEKEIKELLVNYEEDILRENFLEAMRGLSEAEREKDEKKIKKLLEECNAISRKLAETSKLRFN